MKPLDTLGILIIIAVVGGSLVVYGGYYIIDYSDLTSSESVPILAGIVGFLASIVTAMHQEISSRYKEKRDRAARRWEMLFPMIKEGYQPWINSARRLSDSLEPKDKTFSDAEINKILYYCCLFYGLRLQFILDHGDAIMLGSTEDEKNVKNSYDNLKKSFQWAGVLTRRRASELQKYFIDNNSKDNILVFETFAQEFLKSPPMFKESKEELKKWLRDEMNIKHAKENISNFVNTFQNAIYRFSGREA